MTISRQSWYPWPRTLRMARSSVSGRFRVRVMIETVESLMPPCRFALIRRPRVSPDLRPATSVPGAQSSLSQRGGLATSKADRRPPPEVGKVAADALADADLIRHFSSLVHIQPKMV